MNLDPRSSSSSSSSTPESKSRKRKRSIRNPNPNPNPPSRWRDPEQHQIYTSNLLSALRRLPRSPPTATAVRAAAVRALAAAARGRSRWSRAILSGRGAVHLKARLRPRASLPSGAAARSARRSPVEVKIRVLGRLVPGCRKLPLPSLLDEAADYIAALEVQTRAMSMLAGVLAGLPAVPT